MILGNMSEWGNKIIQEVGSTIDDAMIQYPKLKNLINLKPIRELVY